MPDQFVAIYVSMKCHQFVQATTERIDVRLRTQSKYIDY